jgi:DNA-binding helix-hairpin-helix protein with protein kinase domain
MLYDERGVAVTIGNRLGAGGEGEVFEIAGRPDTVFKRYTKGISQEQEDKLRAMVGLKDSNLLSFSAWPTGIVTEGTAGRPVGFLMPNLAGFRKLPALYTIVLRKRRFPGTDWEFLVHAARNTAAAFGAIHAHGCVVGDVNEENIVVNDQATVRLIDCDSMQVAVAGRQYLCPVARPFYVPPELQGASFRSTARTANHDLFGMGVLCFHLLFLGLHPFKGRPRGGGELKIEDAIRQGLFVYGSDAVFRGVRPPPGAPSFAMLPPEVRNLFEMAFGDGGRKHGRPVSDEWVRAFEQLRKDLAVCGRVPGHRYPQGAPHCPWCELEGRGMSPIFPGAGGGPGGGSGGGGRSPAGLLKAARKAVEQAWRQIKAIRMVPAVTDPPAVPKTPVTGVPAPPGLRRGLLPRWLAEAIVLSVCLGCVSLGSLARPAIDGVWAAGGVFVISGGSCWVLLAFSHDGYREEWRKRRRRLRQARRRVNRFGRKWQTLGSNERVQSKQAKLSALYQEYQKRTAVSAMPASPTTERQYLMHLTQRLQAGAKELQEMGKELEAARRRVASAYVAAVVDVRQATADLQQL